MIAEGIVIADGIGQRAGNGQRLAPGVVGILDNLGVGAVNQPDHVALQVIQVAVLRAVEFHNRRAVLRIVPEVQLRVALGHVHNVLAVQRVIDVYKRQVQTYPLFPLL